MAQYVYATEETVVTLADGRVVEAMPVRIVGVDDPLQNSGGQWVNPMQVNAVDDGSIFTNPDTGRPDMAYPVRVVETPTVQNLVGNWVDSVPVFVLSGNLGTGPEITPYTLTLAPTDQESFNPAEMLAAPDGNEFTVTIPVGSQVSMRYIA